MKKIICLFACLYAGSAHAIITSGNIFEDGSGSTVDHWGFSITTADSDPDSVTIDILSWEFDEKNGTGLVIDVNGDGEIAFFDSVIYLFNNDGSLDVGDLIASNESSTSTFGDGSISTKDSFLEWDLFAGDYILAIGAFSFSTDEAIAGVNDPNFYPATCTGGIGVACGNLIGNDHGDYQITWSDNVTITSDPGTATSVPEPSILALLGLGLAGIGFSRKKKAN